MGFGCRVCRDTSFLREELLGFPDLDEFGCFVPKLRKSEAYPRPQSDPIMPTFGAKACKMIPPSVYLRSRG